MVVSPAGAPATTQPPGTPLGEGLIPAVTPLLTLAEAGDAVAPGVGHPEDSSSAPEPGTNQELPVLWGLWGPTSLESTEMV